jgi:hypothetical protein
MVITVEMGRIGVPFVGDRGVGIVPFVVKHEDICLVSIKD